MTGKDEEHNGSSYCMVGYAAFTEYAWGDPMTRKKKTIDIVNAKEDKFSKMRTLKSCHSDHKGFANHVEYINQLNKHTIKHTMVVDGDHTIEIYSGTLTNHIQTRLNAMGVDGDKSVS